MTALALRRLPVELQAILLAYRAPVHYSAAPSRRAITLSAAARPIQSSSSSSSFIAEQSSNRDNDASLLASTALFEQDTSEYSNLPLSRLDHPSMQPREQPRTPDQALLALLEANDHLEANNLRHDLIQSGQTIAPHVAFAQHAHHLFEADSSSTEWLEWWALAPDLLSLVKQHNQLSRVRSARRQLSSLAESMIDSLLQLDDRNWDRTRQFAALLAAQGHSILVSEHLLVHLAAYAPLEISQDVWKTQLEALNQRHLEVDVIPLSSDENASTLRAWYADAVQYEARLLSLKRQKMLKTHAAFGRLDLVLQLLREQHDMVGPGATPLRTKKSTLVWLMAIAASSDRYDIFSRLYSDLKTNGARLTRVTTARLRNRIPYFARNTLYSAPDAAPSAAEAFATWRYRQHKSNLEEGFLEADEVDTGDSSRGAFAREMSAEQPDFAQATRLFKMTLTEQRLPLAHITASYIRLARNRGRTDILSQLSALLVPTKGVRERLARHWQTATLLADVQDGHFEVAVRRYMRYWLYTGLDESLVQALMRVTQGKKQRGAARRFRFTTDAYVLSIVMEALLPLLEPAHRHIGSDIGGNHVDGFVTSPVVDKLYDSLICVDNPPKVVPRWSPHAVSLDGSPNRSLLDPHTFTPFMTRLARLQASPRAALDVVLDMQRLGLSPTPHQLAILIASYARRGAPRDVFWLLNLVEGKTAHELDVSLDSQQPLDQMLKRIQWAPIETQSTVATCASAASASASAYNSSSASSLSPSIIVYTGAVTGLIGQGEWQAARQVIERVRERGLAVQGDAMWRRVVGWVEQHERRQEGGGGAGGAAAGQVEGQQWKSVKEEMREQARLVRGLSL